MAGGPLTSDGTRRGPRQKRVGDLRHRVKIQRLDQSTLNEFREPVDAWIEVATVWASVEPLVGKEFFASGVVQANATHRVIMRHRADVTPKHRLIWVTSQPANKVLNIAPLLPTVGAGNSLELWCVEEQSAE